MPVINDIVQELIGWFSSVHCLPKLREITSVGALPAAAYPQLAVLVDEEVFAPDDAEVTAQLTLRLSCAAGRPADALATCRDLAHQLRAVVNLSHGLGGTVKRLRAGGIRYRADGGPEGGVIAVAEIDASAKYCISPLAA
jgi:hypothetical protein